MYNNLSFHVIALIVYRFTVFHKIPGTNNNALGDVPTTVIGQCIKWEGLDQQWHAGFKFKQKVKQLFQHGNVFSWCVKDLKGESFASFQKVNATHTILCCAFWSNSLTCKTINIILKIFLHEGFNSLLETWAQKLWILFMKLKN